MFKFGFKVKHNGCSETKLSEEFPKYHIRVIDIQSKSERQKQYFYYVNGKEKEFKNIISYLKKSGCKQVKELGLYGLRCG